MKRLYLLLISLFCLNVVFAQDTIIVQTFTLDSVGRSGIFQFPEDPGTNWEKIIMQYRMRCHDALVGNGNVGCWEWDYSCHTVIVDSNQTDSTYASHPSHVIIESNSNPYYYVNDPTHTYYHYTQQEVTYDQVISEDYFRIGDGNQILNIPFQTSEQTGKTQILLTASEVMNSGLQAGDITGLIMDIGTTGSEMEFLKIKFKHTGKTELDSISPDTDGFTEAYFLNTTLDPDGEYHFKFYEPFTWDGISGLLIELSYSNQVSGNNSQVYGGNTGINSTLHSAGDDGSYSCNRSSYIDVPPAAFASVDSVITISFWQYGDIDVLPRNTFIFYGSDQNNRRVLNCHLPWSNGNIYWDAGNSGSSSYDRINKAASFSDYAGQWNHWVFVKNSVTGAMKIYLNGSLWHSGTGKTRSMAGITRFGIGGRDYGSWFGRINEFRIWNTELDSTDIQEWMYKDLDASHPDYDKLQVYYKFDENTGSAVNDHSGNNHHGEVIGIPQWDLIKGNELIRNFNSGQIRPNIELVQGSYQQTITTTDYLDSIQKGYEIVYDYYVENNNLIRNDTNYYYEAGYMSVYNELNTRVDSVFVPEEDSINIETLNYYSKSPTRFKLLSFVTPYGNGLDLGIEGKMWEFDVTDFAPILTGERYLFMNGGGQWSEEFDIRFLFIEGTPPRDVVSIQNIWPVSFSPAWFNQLINDQKFEPRSVLMNPDASQYKLRSMISGHSQQGEFTNKRHYLTVDEDTEFEYHVWKECSDIPIYPQGGTWIYDRAGWCPGDPTLLFEYDITDLVEPGNNHTIDYGIKYYPTIPDGKFIISNQLVSYGDPNFNLDAAIISVGNPNSRVAEFQRFNPSCMDLVVNIRNRGATTLTSLDIEYSIEGGETLNYTWNGSLEFLEQEAVTLPVTDYSFWVGTSNHFIANISSPNGGTDEYPNNNTYRIEYEEVATYDDDITIIIECKTNNYGYQTSYTLSDAEGNIILVRDDLDNNTIYTDELDLAHGCYKIRLDDSADDGLYWWHNSSQGTGYFKLKDSEGPTLMSFEPEFGRFMEYEFAVANTTGIENNETTSILSVYPNPATDMVYLEFRGYVNNKVSVTILNEAMLPVMKEGIKITSDSQVSNLNLKHLPSGIYFIQIITDGKQSVEKLVKY